MVDCSEFGKGFAKIFLYTSSILVLLVGIGTLGLGIWLFTVSDNFSYLLDEETLYVVAIMTITCGTISILAGVYGFYGNTKEKKYVLVTYAIVLAVIIFAEFTAGIMALVYQDKVRVDFETNLKVAVQIKYTPYGSPEAVSSVDYIQKKCKCCGADGPSDWLFSYYNSDTGYNVPKSCCREGLDGTCQDDSYYSSSIYQEGCTINAGDWIQKNLVIVGATCLGVIPIHGIAILAVVCVQKLVVYPSLLI